MILFVVVFRAGGGFVERLELQIEATAELWIQIQVELIGVDVDVSIVKARDVVLVEPRRGVESGRVEGPKEEESESCITHSGKQV